MICYEWNHRRTGGVKKTPGSRQAGQCRRRFPQFKPNPTPDTAMLNHSLVFLVVAILAAALGFGSLSGLAATMAKICFVIFLVAAIFGFLKKGK